MRVKKGQFPHSPAFDATTAILQAGRNNRSVSAVSPVLKRHLSRQYNCQLRQRRKPVPRKQATLRTRSSLALLHIAGGFYKRDRRNTPAKLQLNYETGNFPARYLLSPLFSTRHFLCASIPVFTHPRFCGTGSMG